jgi:hypothetical protein
MALQAITVRDAPRRCCASRSDDAAHCALMEPQQCYATRRDDAAHRAWMEPDDAGHCAATMLRIALG